MGQLKRLIEDVGMELSGQKPAQRRPPMELGEFATKVSEFNSLGKGLYEVADVLKLAEEMKNIAETAEMYALKEGEGEWFDGMTVKRNMKELKGYVTEFAKIAREARTLNQRMTALYEDSGRVLGRYFEIKELKEAAAKAGQTCEGCGKQMEACRCDKETESQPVVKEASGSMVDLIMSYEDGSLSDAETLKLFSMLIKSGQAWSLQGSYGRTAKALIDGGYIDKSGKILKQV